jgi:hypothetical protein
MRKLSLSPPIFFARRAEKLYRKVSTVESFHQAQSLSKPLSDPSEKQMHGM